MRWLIHTDDAWPAPGGVATWTARVVAHLRGRGDEVQVFARHRSGLPPGTHGLRQPSFARWGFVGHTLAHLKEPRPDVCLATTWHVAPLRHRGLVVCHGSDVVSPALWPARRRRVLGRARVAAVSRYLAGVARREGAGAVAILPAPIAAAGQPRAMPAVHRWGWAGRMVPGKGGERFVRMVAEARVSAVMLGDGPLRGAWQHLADRLGARVSFPGWIAADTLAAALEPLALLALPAERRSDGGEEGLGMALIEAAARGVPVVGVRVGGIPEAVGPGLLLDDPDDPAASAAQMRAWLTPERGAEAWEWVRREHGPERTVQALLRARSLG